jgi:hypothetical protein
VHWIRRYILFHEKRHPLEMAEAEINAFLTHLATARRVSPSTQTQALCALLFLYRNVLGREIGELDVVRARRRRRELWRRVLRGAPISIGCLLPMLG